MTISAKAAAWFEARAIDLEIVARMRVYSVKRAQAGGEVIPDPAGDVLAFPNLERGAEVATKYRAKPRPDGSKVFWQKPGGRKTFYNADVLDDPALQDGSQALVITEGELDCLAVLSSRYPFCVSVPDGAPAARDKDGNALPPVTESAQDIDPEQDSKYAYIKTSWTRLRSIKRVVLMADGDEPGERLREELARRIGRVRCYFVTYPGDCKDANEVLQRHGADAVLQLIATAQPFPVRGMYRLSNFPDIDLPAVYSTGWGRLDPPTSPGACSVMLELGAFMVVLGLPESGKSTWALQLTAHLAKYHRWNVGIASFEMKPVPYVRDILRTCRMQQPRSNWTSAAVRGADDWINQHFTFFHIDATNEDDEPTLEWLTDRASDAVIRDGMNVLLIDPWNELEHKRAPGETATEYTNRAIRALKRFARSHDVLVIVIVHPTKDGALHRTPAEMSLYDTEGSAHWVNKPDIGLVVERRDDGGMLVLHGRKFRHRVYGCRGERSFQYVPELGIFSQ